VKKVLSASKKRRCAYQPSANQPYQQPVGNAIDKPPCRFTLKTAVEREKAVQAIDVQRKWEIYVVTFWVMSQCVHFLGASRDCADFRDSNCRF